jgi:hypothetical protein
MKKTLVTMLIASFSLLLSQCSENPCNSGNQTDLSKSIKIAIAIPPGLDSTISSAYVQVSSDSMRTIQEKLFVNDSSISGIVKNVPAGYSRHFEVFVYGSNGKKLMYYGDSYAHIYAGKETYITIILRQPGGTAIINGYIEEYYPPADPIPPPSTPYIYGYKLTQTNPPRCYELSLATDGSAYPDSLYYNWAVYWNNGYDSTFDTYRRGQLLTLEYPDDGLYIVYVRARRMYGDTTEMSPASYFLNFTIRDGLLIDTIIVTDSVPPVISLLGDSVVTLAPGDTFIEPGYFAYDNIDGDISSKVTTTKYENEGFFFIVYVVWDNAGNRTSVRRFIYTNSYPLSTINKNAQ